MNQGIRMDDTAKNIIPTGDRVLLRFEEIPQPQPEIPQEVLDAAAKGDQEANIPYVPPVFRAYIDSVGPHVSMDEMGWKLGDWVVFNGADVMAIDLPVKGGEIGEVRRLGMTSPNSIWGVYEEDDE